MSAVAHPAVASGRRRVVFVNENIGGHAALHTYLRGALARDPVLAARIQPAHLDVAPPSLARRLVGARVPGLQRLDLDLQPLRAQLALSAVVHQRLRRLAPRADVLHVYTQNAGLVSPSLLADHPTVVSTDATTVQNGYQLPYRRPTRFTRHTVELSRRLERRVFEAATLVVAHSAWAAASIRDDYGIAPERLRVIPFGVLAPDTAPRRPDRRRPRIVFIGTTMDRKGGWTLLEVFRRHLRGRASLHLVTRDEVPAEPDVHVYRDLVPGDRRLPALLASASVLAFPSTIDKYSFGVLEAMAAGVAPVVFPVGGVPELVDDQRTGLVVDGADGLATGLRRLVDDPDEAEVLGQAARQAVLERFDARVTTTQLADVLDEAIARHRGTAVTLTGSRSGG